MLTALDSLQYTGDQTPSPLPHRTLHCKPAADCMESILRSRSTPGCSAQPDTDCMEPAPRAGPHDYSPLTAARRSRAIPEAESGHRELECPPSPLTATRIESV